ncbi:Peptidase C60 sortase A and B [Frankia canadensis]|uniref:Peptidase C60 sortase A and B n=1 Tax=Frankia canadensis TaxID=1836972 RepID=A0A2I2KUN8_9ACTN|nr:class F sortase [Frankia canadensis]SNQ49376.1 Peptidase C60 sortase A and B [Frankia canadensis]SOU56666.1 Peptidase C60 sortase A and B [Frankia canadensis]
MTSDPTAAGGDAGGRTPRPGHDPRRWSGRRRSAVGAVLAAVLVLAAVTVTGCGSGQPATTGGNPRGTPPAEVGAVTSGAAAPGTTPGAEAGTVADPVRLRVPDLAVMAPVVALQLDAAGTLIPPAGFDEVGWNQAGPEPGDDGVAVIAGHVDSRTGPAVFYRLRGLRAGATVFVDRRDGTTATFVVDRLAEYAKADFPDQEVYHSGSGAQLRLITCGGTFDHRSGHYVDNVVVFAHLG